MYLSKKYFLACYFLLAWLFKEPQNGWKDKKETLYRKNSLIYLYMVSMKGKIPYGLYKPCHKNANRSHFIVLRLKSHRTKKSRRSRSQILSVLYFPCFLLDTGVQLMCVQFASCVYGVCFQRKICFQWRRLPFTKSYNSLGRTRWYWYRWYWKLRRFTFTCVHWWGMWES